MKKYSVELILPLILFFGIAHANELSSAEEQALIHDANVALSNHDYDVAFSKYLKLAEQGNIAAQCNVGVLYLNGQGVQKDDQQAFSWIRKSAMQGYPRALGVIKNAAAQGNQFAQKEFASLNGQSPSPQEKPNPTIIASPSMKTVNVAKEETGATTPTADSDEDGKSHDKLSVSFGFDYTSGSYGTKQESTSTSIPTIFSYGTDRYAVAMTVPYLEQTGPAGSIAGSRRHIVVGSNKIISNAGLGDVLSSLTGYLIDDENSGFSLDAKAEVKFGTADVSTGLGTGKNDYSLEADLYEDFDKFSLSGTLGYTSLGSPGVIVVNGVKENIVFHNVYYTSVDATYNLSDITTAGLILHTEQSSENGMPGQEDITADFTHKINKTNKLDVYILKGLSNGSPNTGFGASLKCSF